MNNWNTMWDSLQGSMGVHIPQVLGALAIFIIGWFAAALVKAGADKYAKEKGLTPRDCSKE